MYVFGGLIYFAIYEQEFFVAQKNNTGWANRKKKAWICLYIHIHCNLIQKNGHQCIVPSTYETKDKKTNRFLFTSYPELCVL